MRQLSLPALLVAAMIGAMGCSDDPAGPPVVIEVELAPAASGDGQSGTVGTQLGQNLRVLVTRNTIPAAGVSVRWAAPAGNGDIGPAVATTDDDGIAHGIWILPTTAGTFSATATVDGAVGSPVNFSATAVPGPATSFTLVAGNNQSVPVNGTTDEPLTVSLKDSYGNGIGGSTVTWSVFSGTATVSENSNETTVNGFASVTATAGNTAGAVVIRAIPSVALPSLDFSLTVTP